MQELLARITLTITEYRSLPDVLTFNETAKLNSLMKNLSSDLFFLEKYREEYSRKFNAIMHNEIKEGEPVSKSEVKAKEAVPELYMLRRLMTSAYKTQDAMRSNQSYLKKESN